jgi:riboflavin kinase/FMN adenylyltransferase
VKIITDISQTQTDQFVATIGFFDGVHVGHRFLLQHLKDEAKRLGKKSLVISFQNHPRSIVSSDFHISLLTTCDEKITLLSEIGIDACVFLPFDKAMASLTAYEFLDNIILKKLGVHELLVGYDHRFGRNRAEGFDDYVRYGKQLGIHIIPIEALDGDRIHISSSQIRKLLLNGEIDEANKMLNRPYQLSGTVVSGEQLGQKLGFPTANINPEKDKLIPANGVYVVDVTIDGKKTYKGMLNIGYRPTVTEKKSTQIEVHLLDFSEQIYGHSIELFFLHKLRDEVKFNSTEELIEQLKKDKQDTINYPL